MVKSKTHLSPISADGRIGLYRHMACISLSSFDSGESGIVYETNIGTTQSKIESVRIQT